MEKRIDMKKLNRKKQKDSEVTYGDGKASQMENP